MDAYRPLECPTKGDSDIVMGHDNADDIPQGDIPACLHMLFPPGERPDSATLQSAIEKVPGASVSLLPEPQGDAIAAHEAGWAELLLDGLTFDCLGLAPATELKPPPPRHLMVMTAAQLGEAEAIALMPGPHLAGARNSLPVLLALTRLARELGCAFGNVEAYAWGPARFLIGPAMFDRLIADWRSGGAFPSLLFVGVVEDGDGAIRSEGFSFFAGQEFRLAPSLGLERVSGAKLIARLVDELVGGEPLASPVQTLSESGMTLTLRPAEDGAIIQVTGETAR